MNVAACPHKETLFGYVVGTISEDKAEVVAQHLDACHACEQTVQALEGLSDTMISTLRQPAHGDAYAEEPECGQVLEKLRLLQIGRPESDSRQAAVNRPKQSHRGTTLGDYKLLKKLGQGGMGAVYKALHTRLKRVVALKVLRKDRLANEQTLARFEREMEAVGRLDHPNIVRAMDARKVGGIRFLVMEYVEGLDLSEVVGRCGPLSIPDACEAIRQAALGLECSQENGLVHRDVKPSNLMLSSAGQVKLLDLGLAHIQEAEAPEGEVTGIGQVIGTPDYMSPEQAMESHTVDIRTDVYSLGCTLYYLLTGRPPFGGPEYDTAMKKVTGHIRDAVPSIHSLRPDVPKPISALIERMLAKDLSQRIATPSGVVGALAPFCEGSKLIGLLREARANEEEAEGRQSHIETGELQASAIVDTSRDELPPGGKEEEPSGSDQFNPYHRWLGIPPEEQPPNHYRLLGLALFEDDPEVVHDAAARQMAHVRTYHLGPHAELSQKILDALGAAKACLLNPRKKAAYDAGLREEQASNAVEEQKLPEEPSMPVEFSILVDEPGPRTPLARSRFHIRKPPAPGWIAAGAAALVVLFGVVIYITTGEGQIKIALSDPKAEVEMKIDGDEIESAGLENPIRLRPGAHELVVTGPNYETVCQSFTVRRGDNESLKVTLVPLAPETPSGTVATETLEQGGVTAGLPAEPVKPLRWLGYTIHEQPDHVADFAGYTNIVFDSSWSRHADAVIQAAREHRLKVVLEFHSSEREGIEEPLFALAEANNDVVIAICWTEPYFSRYLPSALSAFGRQLHERLSDVELWASFVEKPRGIEQTLPVPKEVDALVVNMYYLARPPTVRQQESILGGWVTKAAGRPVLVRWIASDLQHSSGIVPECEPETIRALAQVAESRDLRGLLFDSYGPRDKRQGLVSKPTLVEEIERVARNWEIAREHRPAAIPPEAILDLNGLAPSPAFPPWIDPMPARAPAPDGALVAKTEREIRDRFITRKTSDWLAVAKDLLDTANVPIDQPHRTFAQLSVARHIQAEEGDYAAAMATCDQIAERFDVDVVSMKARTLMKYTLCARTRAAAEPLVEAAICTGFDAVALEDYRYIDSLVRIATAANKEFDIKYLDAQTEFFAAEAADAQSEYELVKPFAKRWRENPDDPESNDRVGRFLCLVKNDWKRGLPMLARGANDNLGDAVEKEMTPPTTAGKMAILGHDWWDLGEKTATKDQPRYRRRARHWYLKSLAAGRNSLASHVTRKIERRLQLVPGRPFTIRFQVWNSGSHTLRISRNGVQSLQEAGNSPKIKLNHYTWMPDARRFLPNTGASRIFPEEIDFTAFDVEVLAKQSPAGPQYGQLSYRRWEDHVDLTFRCQPPGVCPYWDVMITFRDHTPMKDSLIRPIWWVHFYKYDPRVEGLPPDMAEVVRLQRLSLSRLVKGFTFMDVVWGSHAPYEGVPADYFAVVATSTMDVKKGRYKIRCLSDDGVRVFVDRKLVIDDWHSKSTRENLAQLDLVEGKHDIRLEYFEHDGDAYLSCWIHPLESTDSENAKDDAEGSKNNSKPGKASR